MSTCTSRSLVTLHAFVAVCILSVCGRPSVAGVVYVKATTPGSVHDGSSWATAFPTVQQGINTAVPGDEVWVAASTYQENISLKSGVGLFGGFNGTETGRSQRNPSANVTTLDGQRKLTVVTVADNATSETAIDGFTIRNGEGSLVNGYGSGGGVYVASGSPVVSNNIITSCDASLGGGICINAGTPLIAGNTISGNSASYGGGIYALGGLIRDNYIAYNWAIFSIYSPGIGGGIYLHNAVAIHNIIRGNSAPGASAGGGGGVICWSGVVMDNVFQDNIGTHGAALVCGGNSTVIRNTITDSYPQDYSSEVDFGSGTFSNNLVLVQLSGDALTLGLSHDGNLGGTLISNNTFIKTGEQTNTAIWSLYRDGEHPVLANNIALGWQAAGRTWNGGGGTPPVFTTDHNDVYGNTDNTLPFPGTFAGNISQDPLFVDAANGDYRLQTGSPCTDAGNDAYVASGDRDAEGRPRIFGARVDIGAYEYGSPLYTVADAAEVLRIAAGLSISTPANVTRLDVVQESPGTPSITVADATLIARWLLN